MNAKSLNSILPLQSVQSLYQMQTDVGHTEPYLMARQEHLSPLSLQFLKESMKLNQIFPTFFEGL